MNDRKQIAEAWNEIANALTREDPLDSIICDAKEIIADMIDLLADEEAKKND